MSALSKMVDATTGVKMFEEVIPVLAKQDTRKAARNVKVCIY